MGGGYSAKELYEKYAVASRLDTKEVIFIKRVLQVVLPEYIRTLICDELFEEYMDVTEEVLAKELYMNMEQMECMKDNGMFFGLHGYDHYWLGKLEKEKMIEDMDRSVQSLQPVLEKNMLVINYPYGSFNEDVITHARTVGCKLGFSTEVGSVDTANDNAFTLKRLDTNDFPPKSNDFKKYRRENK